ncbi:MAG: hypothetical protein ACRD17_09065 [Terriglobales bacterium]
MAFVAGFALVAVQAQSWAPLKNEPGFNAGTAILLTDGTVMVQSVGSGDGSGNWYLLTPDASGSYLGGTWTQLASMPSGYAPLYYASAVLPDGRVLFEGGEYNGGAQDWTGLGAVFDPVADSWTSVSPPSTWTSIGDAESVVLADGTFTLADCCGTSPMSALFDEDALSWTATGAGKQDSNDEEGWVLLPNGDVLTVVLSSGGSGTASELYNPATGDWSPSGSIPLALENSGCYETGPMVLRPDGTVFAIGGTGNTDVYTPSSGAWAAGPVVPGGFGVDDGPAALLPNGNVLFQVSMVSGGCYSAPSEFFTFDGTTLAQAPSTPNASGDASYTGRMLVLPTGQVLYTDQTTDVEVFTPGATYQAAWQPTISTVAPTLNSGSTNNTISGTQFNGLSQGAMYGDDAQMATNYPLVRITNNATRSVFYCRTHGFSSMGVATGSAAESAEFDVPSDIETGPSSLEVVANGIPSDPVGVTVNGPEQDVTFTPPSPTFKTAIRAPDTETVYLNNNGPGTLVITSFSVDDLYAYFSLKSTTCGTSLGQGSSCGFTITFDPQSSIPGGWDDGQLDVSDTGQGGGQELELKGYE